MRVPAGSESFEALIYNCINKAKKSTANKNNNSRFKKGQVSFTRTLHTGRNGHVVSLMSWLHAYLLNNYKKPTKNMLKTTIHNSLTLWQWGLHAQTTLTFSSVAVSHLPLLSLDVSTSQTQQPHASQASEQREHLSSPSKKKWKSTLRKSPCLHLSSLLRWLHPREDRKSLLASMDPAPSNYGSLLWEPPLPQNSLNLSCGADCLLVH